MLAIVFAVVLGGGLVWIAVQNREARLRVVEEAFRALKANPARTSEGVQGRVKGLLLTFASEYRRQRATGDDLRENCCRVALPAGLPPFEMDLRPETRLEEIAVEKGRAVDLVLGDPRFDESFIVEAAPAEFARALLDEPARTGLLAFHPCHMTVEDGELKFSKRARLDELAEVKRVLELCSHVASRLQTLSNEFQEQRLLQAQGAGMTGYRGPTPEAMRALAAGPETAAEVAGLHQLRAQRKRRQAVLQGAMVVVLVLAGVVVQLLLNHAHR